MFHRSGSAPGTSARSLFTWRGSSGERWGEVRWLSRRGRSTSLADRDWRNNVRELRNTVIGAIIRSEGGVIQLEDLGYEGLESFDEERSYHEAKDRVVQQFQRRYLAHLLRTSRGNVSAAADAAGLHRAALSRLLTKLGIDPDAFRS